MKSALRPLFFIGRTAVNGRVEASHTINGARPFEVFEAVLESLLGSQ